MSSIVNVSATLLAQELRSPTLELVDDTPSRSPFGRLHKNWQILLLSPAICSKSQQPAHELQVIFFHVSWFPHQGQFLVVIIVIALKL
jgi:hypothetical protein